MNVVDECGCNFYFVQGFTEPGPTSVLEAQWVSYKDDNRGVGFLSSPPRLSEPAGCSRPEPAVWLSSPAGVGARMALQGVGFEQQRSLMETLGLVQDLRWEVQKDGVRDKGKYWKPVSL